MPPQRGLTRHSINSRLFSPGHLWPGSAPCTCLGVHNSRLNPTHSLCSRVTFDPSFLSLEHSPIFTKAHPASLVITHPSVHLVQPVLPSWVRFLQLPPHLLTPILPKHLSKDLNRKWQKLSSSSTKVLIILNKQESVEQVWSFQMISVEMVKEEGKKNICKEPHDYSESKNPAAGVSRWGLQGGVLGDPATTLVLSSHGLMFCSSYGSMSLPRVF